MTLLTATHKATHGSALATGEAKSRRLLILMPGVWSVRNVIDSGILRALTDQNIEVHLLLRSWPPPQGQSVHQDFRRAASIQELRSSSVKYPRLNRLLPDFDVVLQAAYNRRYHISSYSIYERWRNRHYRGIGRALYEIIRSIGTLAQPWPIFSTLVRYAEWHYTFTYDLEPIRRQLTDISPNMIWSTLCISTLEYPYVYAARELGIPVVTSILSFDNLTSRGIYPEFDHYLVWNKRMRDQVMRFYPQVTAERISVTGTPQFDFHLRPSLTWSRRKTLNLLQLPVDARFFLYATRIQGLGPQEPELVAELARRISNTPALKEYWLVVRVHPLDDPDRWRLALADLQQVVISQSLETRTDLLFWALTSMKDHARLISSIAHSEAVINISSTISLDAAILDRPAICIDFSHEPDAPRDILYEEHLTEHFLPIINSGGVGVAHSWVDLLHLMQRAVSHPNSDHEARRRLVSSECGQVDGHASERVVSQLIRLLFSHVALPMQSSQHSEPEVA